MSGKMMRITLALVLVAGALALVGCNKIAEEASEAIVEGATGVDVEVDEEKVTIEGEDGESIEIQGESSELPDGFPDEMPVYDADIVSSTRMAVDNQTSYTVIQTTTDSSDDVIAWYHDELAKEGWTEAGTTESEVDGAKFAMFIIERSGVEGTVSVHQDADTQEVMISTTVVVTE